MYSTTELHNSFQTPKPLQNGQRERLCIYVATYGNLICKDVRNCDDHSSLDFESAVQYMKHFIYHFTFDTLLANYAKNRLVEAAKNLIQRMKDLLLGVHTVVETISIWKFDIVVWQTTSKNATVSKYLPCRTCSTIIFPYSTNQITVFWRCLCRCLRPCLKSNLLDY